MHQIHLFDDKGFARYGIPAAGAAGIRAAHAHLGRLIEFLPDWKTNQFRLGASCSPEEAIKSIPDYLGPAVTALWGRLQAVTDPFTLTTLIVESKLLAQGPRVFCPSMQHVRDLESVEIPLPVEDYDQPYPVMVVDFPLEYGLAKYALLYHNKEYDYILATTHYAVDDSSSCAICFHEVEETLAGLSNKQERPLRAALNLCMMLYHGGSSSKLLDPDQAKRNKKLAKSHIIEKRRQGRQALREQIELVTLDQDIRAFARRQYDALPVGEKGPCKRPHWRRGHKRMQPFGPGRSQKKEIRIPPSLIHPELFGDSTNTVTYRG
jgi:hypothetical protein